MAPDLLSQAGRDRAAAKADGARVLGRLVERAQHARQGSAAETYAALIGDLLRGFPNGLFLGHSYVSSGLNALRMQRVRHWRKKVSSSSNVPGAETMKGLSATGASAARSRHAVRAAGAAPVRMSVVSPMQWVYRQRGAYTHRGPAICGPSLTAGRAIPYVGP